MPADLDLSDRRKQLRWLSALARQSTSNPGRRTHSSRERCDAAGVRWVCLH
jgi:hypothetical protein